MDYQGALKKLSDKQFDIVFLDPPFRQDLIAKSLKQLSCLSPNALIYIEAEKQLPPPQLSACLPGNYEATRQGTAGDVAYYLCHTVAG